MRLTSAQIGRVTARIEQRLPPSISALTVANEIMCYIVCAPGAKLNAQRPNGTFHASDIDVERAVGLFTLIPRASSNARTRKATSLIHLFTLASIRKTRSTTFHTK